MPFRVLASALAGLVSLLPLSTSSYAAEPERDRPDDVLRLDGTVAITGNGDPAAERVLRRLVTEHGGSPTGQGESGAVTIRLGRDDALPPEGFRLEIEPGQVELSGGDAPGLFYGALELRDRVRDNTIEPGSVEEAPTMKYRGLIEGFYGTPWSHADRLGLIDYLGEHRMNTFEYAPKDDPYHREKWREPYPADELAELGELAERAIAQHVDFTFALSPGLSICYTSEADFEALTAKFDSLYELGVRHFNIPLDDIDYNTWHCDADKDKYGTGAAAAGTAQSDLLNRVQREWVEPKGDVAPLQMVPTEYYNTTDSPYKQALRTKLDEKVVVHWTGVGVIPTTITREQAAAARKVFGHDILIWDNYPVNDYIAGRLPLGPYTGRENGLSNEVVGVISNPMNQAAVSKLALFSFGEYGWDDNAYDAQESWQRALDERAGGDRKVREALGWFADLNHLDTTLHQKQSPRLTKELDTFWNAWNAGDTETAARDLDRTLATLEAVPGAIRDGVPDKAFAEEAKAWLDATELWIRAMRASLAELVALDRADPATAWRLNRDSAALVEKAKAIRDGREPHSKTYPRIGDSVVDAFIAEADTAFQQAVAVGLDRPKADTSLGTYAGNDPARMVDGDDSTYFWSDGSPKTGDHVTVDLGKVRPIGAVALRMAKQDSPNDFIAEGVLEFSEDGSTWTELAKGTTADVEATAPDGATARYVRYRATADNAHWLVVREFSVEALDVTRLTAEGTPDPAEGSALDDAVDSDLDTAYVAARNPQAGDELTASLSEPRAVDTLYVLQRRDGAGAAALQIRTPEGTWRTIGQVRSAYTQVDVGATIDAVRLQWKAGTRPPAVVEISPRYRAG